MADTLGRRLAGWSGSSWILSGLVVLTLQSVGCAADPCVEVYAAEAKCADDPWGAKELSDAAEWCTPPGQREPDEYYDCLVSCYGNGTCERPICYQDCLCLSSDSCDPER